MGRMKPRQDLAAGLAMWASNTGGICLAEQRDGGWRDGEQSRVVSAGHRSSARTMMVASPWTRCERGVCKTSWRHSPGGLRTRGGIYLAEQR